MHEEIVYLGLGSNLGDREAHLRAGLAGLQKRGLRLHARSSFYLTEPDLRLPADGLAEGGDQQARCRGGEDARHPWYLNCVAAFTDAPAPRQLLQVCLDVEKEAGRTRGADDAGDGVPQPRTLDVDVLLVGARVIDEPGFRVPHPRMAQRRFVLQPLAEIDPELIHPLTGMSIGAMLDRLARRERVAMLEPQPGEAH